MIETLEGVQTDKEEYSSLVEEAYLNPLKVRRQFYMLLRGGESSSSQGIPNEPGKVWGNG